MVQLTKCPPFDISVLSDDDLIVRAAAVADQRAAMVHEYTVWQFLHTGWWEHENALIDEATARGIEHEIIVARQMGWRAWYSERVTQREQRKITSMEEHLRLHPLDDPYRRPYPSSSWAYFDGAWHAYLAEKLDIFSTTGTGSRRWRGEAHLDGCNDPQHPYYQIRRDTIDEIRSWPGHRRG